jgi:ABC-2 type transport system permease protein
VNNNINWLGLWTLYKREVWRFMKVINQTLLSPVVTTLLFLAVLNLSLSNHSHNPVAGVSYANFIAPGLIMMAVVQNAFANTSSSLMLSKIQGTVIDILMPPFTGAEITFGMVMGGVTRGVMVGLVVGFSVYLFVPFHIEHLGLTIFYLIASSLMLALIGLITGIWSQSFDQLSAITNYIVTPLSFLSGTFYSIKQLPEFWYNICHFNPFFYMIDGFRYSLTNYADSDIKTGMIVIVVTNVILWYIAQTVITKGYRLKT